jgi:hypothetical protein
MDPEPSKPQYPGVTSGSAKATDANIAISQLIILS